VEDGGVLWPFGVQACAGFIADQSPRVLGICSFARAADRRRDSLLCSDADVCAGLYNQPRQTGRIIEIVWSSTTFIARHAAKHRNVMLCGPAKTQNARSLPDRDLCLWLP
jgi:hypothetical protein